MGMQDWIFATIGDLHVVGRISEIVQLQLVSDGHVISVVRLMLQHVVVPAFDADGLVTVPMNATGDGQCMCIPLECTHVSSTHSEVQGGVVRLRLM